MAIHRAIPPGYMTVGEAAKKMGVTVRTLQYYDREGLLSPSAESEGGRRLYTDRDLIRLHQILSLKHLGFSLNDIQNRLSTLDTPDEVAEALAGQADILREKLRVLSDSLREIETLRAEVLQMQSVDFKKYADIIVNLQLKNDCYWMIKHFDDQMLDHIRSRFNWESGTAFMADFQHLCEEAIRLQKEGVPPDSEAAQSLAGTFWEMVTAFTGGDMRLLPKLMALGQIDNADAAWQQTQTAVNRYLGPALAIYFERQGIQPLPEETP